MPKVLIHDLDTTEKGVGSDMSLYFSGTYLKVSDGMAPPQWATYQGYSDQGHCFIKGKGETIYIPAESKKSYVEWYYPVGWFNTKKSAVFCERMPKRQFHKGIHYGANFHVTTAEAMAGQHGFLSSENSLVQIALDQLKLDGKMSMSLPFIKEIAEDPQYPGLEDAYVQLKSKKAFCRALNIDFALMPHSETKDLYVLLHDMVVAEMVTKNKVHVLIQGFKPECGEFFFSKGVSVV